MQIILILLLGFALPAYAHGEDAFTSLFLQLFAVVGTFILLAVVPGLKRYSSIGVIGCLLGVAVSWILTADIPFSDNQTLITIISVAMPLGFAAIAIFLAKSRAGT
ncbi:hypothetical protein [Methylophilus sp. 14]|uniref:hypothetical protein n=1 Tax=Methylophilus sp. 14 TaxID=2781019 RepID=UPI001890425A|nr:hypothetical protein [Methylophilus sp. 14]MBF4987356.1 hypothetical protein [Methylophilus sp. 14]